MENSKHLHSIPTPDSRSVLILPIGGTNRVGLNMMAIGTAGRWILVDAGATFAPADDNVAAKYASEFGGTMGPIIPDVSVINSILPKVDGIVVTHAHEDHIGALSLLHRFKDRWPGFEKIPIFATPYTAMAIKNRLDRPNRPRIVTIDRNMRQKIGAFRVEWVRITHSAPETTALAISTPVGMIVIASDVKLDSSPVLGTVSDTNRLQRLGSDGVLAFLGDSTNAAKMGQSTSEGDVQTSLIQVMKSFPGRVFLSTFSSNLARVEGARRAAQASGRSMAVAGRSIVRNFEMAQKTGLIPAYASAAEPKSLKHATPRETLIVCTGSQAEPGSAMSRMATSLDTGIVRRGDPVINPGDLIVHSARVIPGNEKAVASLLETYERNGVYVLRADAGIADLKVHASGHGHEDEIRSLYRMLRPKFAVPVHGDRRLIGAHIDLARRMPSVRDAISPQEGEILRIAPDGMSIIGAITTRTIASIRLGSSDENVRLAPWPPEPMKMAA